MTRDQLATWAVYLSFGAAVAGTISIAAGQILLGAAIIAIVGSRTRLQFPPIWPAVAVFMIWTLLSAGVAGTSAGDYLFAWPQVKKFFVFLLPVVIYSTLAGYREAQRLLLAAAAMACVSAAWGWVQFGLKFRAARQLGVGFSDYYVANQITGTLSHWMTFSGVTMIALMILLAYIFFAEEMYKPLGPPVLLSAILFVALVLAYVRNMWLAAGVGIVFLVWFWSRWALVPLLVGALAAVLLVTPIRERLISVYRPAPNVIDSRTHREYLRLTGYRMITANPLLGVGPQRVKGRFLEYYPPEAPHPVPSNWYYDHLHNIYVHYAAERGIPALLALLVMILGSAVHFTRALARLPIEDPRRWVLFASLAVIVSALVSGWWEFNLNDSEVLGFFLAVIACGYKTTQEPFDV